MIAAKQTDIAAPLAEELAPGAEGCVAHAQSIAENNTLSTIVRFHRIERLCFLEEALFSLALQSWRDHETVIVIQNGTEEMRATIDAIIRRQPWPAGARHKIISVAIPAGVDGRSTLLTRGIEQANGRYLAFLDDDDFVYQHGYATLIQQLQQGVGAVAVGGCRTVRVEKISDSWYVRTKETPFAWGRTRDDLLRDNFIPIHSYVIDRTRVEPADLYFDDTLILLEDYDFLLRLCVKYEFDFSHLNTPVCEYRIHELNTLPYTASASEQSRVAHLQAQQFINEKKKTLECRLPVSEFLEMKAEVARVTQENQHLKEQLSFLEEEKRRRFLLRLVYKSYGFFGRYPRIEKMLSRFTHAAWRGFRCL